MCSLRDKAVAVRPAKKKNFKWFSTLSARKCVELQHIFWVQNAY